MITSTERLLLRAFTLQDAPFILKLVNTEGWLRFIGDRNIHDEIQARAYIETGLLKSYRENGFGLWAVELKETHKLVGMCGLLKRDYLDYPDIGFAFLPEFSGQGLATEAAKATLRVAITKFNLKVVCAITNPDNVRSIKLLERLGFGFERKIQLPASGEMLNLYKLEEK